MWMSIGIFGLFIVVMYFVMIRPQRKKQKQEEAIRNNVQVGDEIITVGGIYGRVVSIKDDSVVIESSNDRSKNRIAKWAIQTNLSVREEPKKEVKKESKKNLDKE
ncbi:MAG TPA: preprotein translocase subunit YajC [Ruminococcaceae bacterium]|nr:preprotein translocase subunit YajC [Oscillospiraceae bacterium]